MVLNSKPDHNCNFEFQLGSRVGKTMTATEPAIITYFVGKGRAEACRWAMAACDVDFENAYLHEPEDLLKLREKGMLLTNQVPLLQIDGLDLVQSAAIVEYVGNRYSPELMGGGDLAKKAKIDMIRETSRDFASGVMPYIWQKMSGKDYNAVQEAALDKYLPLIERAISNNPDSDTFTVGASMTMGDVLLSEVLRCYCDVQGGETVFENYPRVHAMATAVWESPLVAKYLQSDKYLGCPTETYMKNVDHVLGR